jgi:hypothetical protein
MCELAFRRKRRLCLLRHFRNVSEHLAGLFYLAKKLIYVPFDGEMNDDLKRLDAVTYLYTASILIQNYFDASLTTGPLSSIGGASANAFFFG